MPAPKFTEILPPSLRPSSHAHIASLWSNYGHIYRLTFPSHPPLILKLVQPPPTPRTASESHIRKLLSYRAERHFYTHLSHHLTPHSPIAAPHPVSPAYADTTLLLDDLTPTYPLSYAYSSQHSPAHTAAVLRWLANFHAAFWGLAPAALIPPPLQAAAPDTAQGVWQRGGYWYLDTRAEEMQSFADGPGDYAFLLPHVQAVAERLRVAPGALGATLMHGDCKVTNVVFAPPLPAAAGGEVACALYDFQYVGVGLGVQDLAYFLGTSVGARELEGGGEEALLRVYYDELVAALGRLGKGAGGYTWEVLVGQWEWALVDWMRFMAGWGCWGNSRWVEGRARRICERWEREGME